MDLIQIISELRTQREQIDQAIHSLEQLALPRPRRRGRPPKWLSDAASDKAAVRAITSSLTLPGQAVMRAGGG